MDTETPVADLPDGDYAIAECLGHRTLVGRVSEVERFGTKMLAIEPIFTGKLLPTIFVGGASLYAFTPCSKAAALANSPTRDYQLPASLRATLDLPAIAPPPAFEIDVEEQHDDEE